MGRSGQSTLRLRQIPGKSSYTVISRADGSLTPSGRYLYKKTGRPEPSSQFDRGQPLIKKNSSDFVRTRNGKLALVRKLQADGTTHVTRLGKQYFRGSKTEIIVSIRTLVSEKMRRDRTKTEVRCSLSICWALGAFYWIPANQRSGESLK